MESNSNRLAVLIDGDFIDPADFGHVLAWAASKGRVIIRRIYGNPEKLSDWKKCIDNHGIELVSNYTDGRNAADFAMTIEAIDIRHTVKEINGFCIVTADNHFASLVNRLCKEEYFVAVLWSSRLDEHESSFKDECSVFRHVDELSYVDNPDPLTHEALSVWKDVVRNVLRTCTQKEGWILLSDIGNMLKETGHEFDPHDYCHKRLFSLMKSCPEFETKAGPERVRLQQQP